MDNTDLKLRFSVNLDRSLNHVENVTWKWSRLLERLKTHHIDPLTLEELKALPKERQSQRKASHGFFVGTQFQGHTRKKQFARGRQLITLDLDLATPRILIALEQGLGELGKYEYAVYSTHSHGGGDIKLRVVIPLGEVISADLFQAVARITAWNIDSKMMAVDHVSFYDTQLMYWPAACSDVEPVFIHHPGPIMPPLEVISEWCGDDSDRWKDMALLPRSPREAAHHDRKDKAADPLTKRGYIGAINRAFTIGEFIAEYLSDIYKPADPGRYTYIPGTLVNGAIVYDNDTKLQSHHGSDPCCDQNVNVFDLGRIHLFGHLDTEKDAGKPAREMPSFKAMVGFCQSIPDVVRELRESNYGDMDDAAIDAALGEGLEASAGLAGVGVAGGGLEPAGDAQKPPDEKNGLDRLDLNQHGIVKANIYNLVLILRNWPTFKGLFGHNELTHQNVLRRGLRSVSQKINMPLPPGQSCMGLTDIHMGATRLILESPRGDKLPGWGLRVSERDLREAVQHVCREGAFHPVRDYLSSLGWDGAPRLELLWINGCHTPDTPYYRQTSRNLLIGAVLRVMEPGCKFDFMPVMQGDEGVLKSTMVETLGGGAWTGRTPGHFDDKQKFVEATVGYWFMESPEITHFRRASDDDAIKAALSETHDHIRLSYRRDAETFPRQFVMIGTTNLLTFLRDRSRRIWPIIVPAGQPIDLAWIAGNRDQLFAEAMVACREMRAATKAVNLPLYLTGEAKTEFEERQETHIAPSLAAADAGVVEEWLNTPVPLSLSRPGAVRDDIGDAFAEEKMVLRYVTCGREIFTRAMGGDKNKFTNALSQHVAVVMDKIPGWVRGPQARCGEYGKQFTYRRIVSVTNDL